MAYSNCNVCGSKIGLLNFAESLTEGSNKCICSKCRNLIYNIKMYPNAQDYPSNVRTLTSYYEKATDDDVKRKLEECLNEVSKRKEDTQKTKKYPALVDAHILTTGFEFSGYNIIKYNGIVSGDSVIGTGWLSEVDATIADLFGQQSEVFSEKIQVAKDTALKRMAYNSVLRGGNAIIGISFEYITFPNNMIGVGVNGTSVLIEKEN